uniref:Uncharacterized protein n=1 Tax=Panagrolaimus sp. ES5 TaxID=591445 RepID=A0AC34GNE1_9BILA
MLKENRMRREASPSSRESRPPPKRRRTVAQREPFPVQAVNDTVRAYRRKLRHWISDDEEDSDVDTAEEFVEPILSDNYDRILVHHEARRIDDLFLNEAQIDKMLASMQQSAKNGHVLYLSSHQILSDSVLPSMENVRIIVVPFPGKNGNFVLALFDLPSRTPWRFFMIPYHKYFIYKKIKCALENKLKLQLGPEFSFQVDKRPIECDQLVNERQESYNDGIMVFRAAEDVLFTGWVKYWKKFDVNLERKRYSDIFDTINAPGWDGTWPENLRSESNNSENTVSDDQDTPSQSSSDSQLENNSVNNQESQDSVAEEQDYGNYDTFNDFDDQHTPPPFDELVSDHIPAPANLQVVSPAVSLSAAFNGFNGGTSERNAVIPSSSSRLSLASTQHLSPVNSFNDGSQTGNFEPQIVRSDSEESTWNGYGEGENPNGSIHSSDSDDSNGEPNITVDAPNATLNYNFDMDWRRSLSPPPRELDGQAVEISSLSSVGSSRDSEGNEETNVELSPRSDDNAPADLTEQCHNIAINIRLFWGTVKQLAEERQRLVKKLVKQLSKSRRFKNAEEVLRINSTVEMIEKDINTFMPVVPHFKAMYQNDSNKTIVVRKGFIYERIGETNEFECIFKRTLLECPAYLVTDNSDTIIEGSFGDHDHTGTEEYTEDEPLPHAVPVSLPRVTIEGENDGKYFQLMELLKNSVIELGAWRRHATLCAKKLEFLRGYVNDLEGSHLPDNKYGVMCKMVISESKNLLKNVRLDN